MFKSKTLVLGCIGIFLIIMLLSLFLVYYPRIRSIRSIRKMTKYDDYNLYRMDIDYDYSLEDVIESGIQDDSSLIQAIVQESMPLIPVHMEAPDFGCTAFSMITEDGEIYTGRNYDFKNDTSALLVYCNPKKGYQSMALAALDNVDANDAERNWKTKMATLTAPFVCLDGINEKGVSIAVLTLDSEPVHQNTRKPVISTTLAVRLVLDKAASTDEAISLLKEYDMFASSGRDYHFYINDRDGDGRVVEYDCESESRELVDMPVSAATNFYGIYEEKVKPNQKNGIYGHGKERYEAVLDVLSEQINSVTKDTVWDALKASAQKPNPKDITSNTQWSIAYNNTNQTAELALRRHFDDVIRISLSRR